MSLQIPDQFKAGDDLTRAAKVAEAWIAHLNVLSAVLEGKIRGYCESIEKGTTQELLKKEMQRDLKIVEELHERGPWMPTP